MKRNKTKKRDDLDTLAERYLSSRNSLSDVALLVQKNEDLHNKCKFENERLKLKVNRLLRKMNMLKKKIYSQNKEWKPTASCDLDSHITKKEG